DGDHRLGTGRRQQEGGRDAELEESAPVRHHRGQPRGPEVTRVVAVHVPAKPTEAREGGVAGHHADDGREGMGQLGEAGPEPQRDLYGLRAGDPVAGEREAYDGDPVVLRACGEKEGSIGDAGEGYEQGEREKVLRERLRSRQRLHARNEYRQVERDVDPARLRPAEPRQAREERELDRPDAEEVEQPADRREVATGEGTAPAAEPHDLEEHAPDDGLLESDRPEPPRPDRGEAAQGGAESAEERPA